MKKNKKSSKKNKKQKTISSGSLATLEKSSDKTNITIVGVGGGGGNILNNISSMSYDNVRLVAMNTDKLALERTTVQETLLLGKTRTKGKSASGDPALGYEAAIESQKEIKKTLTGSDLVFLLTGLGGGTGTGASLVVAETAKSLGAKVIVIATTPFSWEGATRSVLSEMGLEELHKVADNVVVLHNNDLKAYLASINESLSLTEAFLGMDRVIGNNIEAFVDLIAHPGLINLDFSDMLQILQLGQTATISSGEASGENRGKIALEKALNNPLLSFDIKDAKGIIVSVIGGDDFNYDDLDSASQTLHDVLPSVDVVYHPGNPFAKENTPHIADIVVGALTKEAPDLNGKVKISIMAVK